MDSGTKHGLRILIAEDEEDIRFLVEVYLKKEGHIVTAAADGLEVVRLFAEGEFDMVLLDIGMPKLSGDEAAAAIKSHGRNVPVVYLTGYNSDTEQVRRIRARGDRSEVLMKPDALFTIGQTLREIYERSRQQVEAA